jgi:alpha-mannosidase
MVTVVKRAEDGDGHVVRGYETDGESETATLHLPFLRRTVVAEFDPHEIKTLFVPDDRSRPVVETDLLEGPLDL